MQIVLNKTEVPGAVPFGFSHTVDKNDLTLQNSTSRLN